MNKSDYPYRYSGTMKALHFRPNPGNKPKWLFAWPALPRGRFRVYDPKAAKHVAWTNSPQKQHVLQREAERRGWQFYIAF